MIEMNKGNSPRIELQTRIRVVRQNYDKLSRGDIAVLRRCHTAADVALEGVFWRIGGSLAQEQRNLAHVVLHFGLAPHRTTTRFSFGRLLQRKLGDTSSGALRFRRLLDSRDRDDLDHRLRGLLRLACDKSTPVDWGVLGVDILWFLASSDNVRRAWAQDFYAPVSSPDGENSSASNP